MQASLLPLNRSSHSALALHNVPSEIKVPTLIQRDMAPRRRIPHEADLVSRAEDMFSFLETAERKWALDFLLAYDSDPAGDVSGLSNSVTYSQGHSSMRFCVASPAPPSQGATSEERLKQADDSPPGTLAFELNFLAIPVWQAAGVCVGIAIQQFVGRHGKSNKFLHIPGAGAEPRAVAYGRFAIDVRTGTSTEILVVKDATLEKESVVHVSHFELKGTQKTVQTIIQADSAVLDLQQPPPQRFVSACVMFRDIVLSRTCPVCSKGADDKCHCMHDFSAGNGALDFQFFRKNAAYLYGADSGTATTIHRWTVDDPFTSSTMFMESTSAPREGGGCFDPLSIALRNIVINEKAQSSGRASREHRALVTEADREKLPSGILEGSAGFQTLTDRVGSTAHVPEPADDVVFMDLAETMDLERANFPFLAVGETAKEPEGQTPGQTPGFSIVDDHDSELALVFGSPAQELDDDPQVLDREIEAAEDPSESMEISVSAELNALVEGDPSEHKRVARQVRNRAAAARSNEKRRQRRIEFQEEMENANRRKKELEEVLEKLKEENAALKARSAQMHSRSKDAGRNRRSDS